jgi:hypothetical protein
MNAVGSNSLSADRFEGLVWVVWTVGLSQGGSWQVLSNHASRLDEKEIVSMLCGIVSERTGNG